MALDTGRIQTNVRKLRKIFKNPAKLRSPNRVHDLRTRTRRLEALLPATEFDSGRKEKRLLRRLRPIRKKAGKVRDMDVLISRLLELDVDRNSEGDCEVQLLEHLGEERCRSGKKLERAVRKHRGEARARLKRISDNIKSIARTSDEEGTNKRRDTRVNAATSVLELASGLSDPNRLNRANLHSYRLKLKELRYLLKSAEGNPDQKFVDALGACKDAIGEWHDWEELVAIANEVLDHGRNCQLVERLKAAAQAKFDTALSVTNRMRSKFIRGRPSRTRRSPNRQRPPKQPGLETAGSLVSSGSRP